MYADLAKRERMECPYQIQFQTTAAVRENNAKGEDQVYWFRGISLDTRPQGKIN